TTTTSSGEAPDELVLEHLPGRVARQRVDELELLGRLLAHGAGALEPRPHVVEVERRGGIWRHDHPAPPPPPPAPPPPPSPPAPRSGRGAGRWRGRRRRRDVRRAGLRSPWR